MPKAQAQPHALQMHMAATNDDVDDDDALFPMASGMTKLGLRPKKSIKWLGIAGRIGRPLAQEPGHCPFPPR